MVTDTLSQAGRGQSRPHPLRRLAAMAHDAVQSLTESDAASITGKSVRLPQWAAMALITWLVTSIWWAATMQADGRHETEARLLLEGRVETFRVEVDALRNRLSETQGALNELRRQRGE